MLKILKLFVIALGQDLLHKNIFAMQSKLQISTWKSTTKMFLFEKHKLFIL